MRGDAVLGAGGALGSLGVLDLGGGLGALGAGDHALMPLDNSAMHAGNSVPGPRVGIGVLASCSARISSGVTPEMRE
jgi:hypothetical protein